MVPVTRIGDAIHILKVLIGDQVYIRNGCILMHTGGSRGVFDNLVKFVYKLGKNWQTRAWDSVFKTVGSAHDAAMILGLFSPKNLKINIDRELYWIVHFYLDSFLCIIRMI